MIMKAKLELELQQMKSAMTMHL